MIASIYSRGNESAAHYKRERNDRPRSWSNVPKNKPSKRVKRVNKWTHLYEQTHGYAMMEVV